MSQALGTSTPPISATRLTQIAQDACAAAFDGAEKYEHALTAKWNTEIINFILKALISESSPPGGQPAYKYAINSTIIQHLGTPSKTISSAESEDKNKIQEHPGRRGMHSATGAFWNEAKDGMWSFKYGDGENKGMDVVICVIWIAV